MRNDGGYIRSLTLNDACVQGIGICKVIVVQLAMLECAAIQPDRSLRLDKQSATIVQIDVVVVQPVKFMIGDPSPIIGHEYGCLRGDVN